MESLQEIIQRHSPPLRRITLKTPTKPKTETLIIWCRSNTFVLPVPGHSTKLIREKFTDFFDTVTNLKINHKLCEVVVIDLNLNIPKKTVNKTCVLINNWPDFFKWIENFTSLLYTFVFVTDLSLFYFYEDISLLRTPFHEEKFLEIVKKGNVYSVLIYDGKFEKEVRLLSFLEKNNFFCYN